MDVRRKIEYVRSFIYTVENWEALVEEKRRVAVWGNGRSSDAVKVQATPILDRLEIAVLNVQELEEHKTELFTQYWQEKEEIMEIISRCAPVEDWTVLHRYMIGVNISDIPLRGKQKDPVKVVRRAIESLQKRVDREEMIMQLPKGVQKLIEGEKRQCKYCGIGLVSFEKEDAEKFIFVCDGCGKRTKADKMPKERKDTE